MDKHINLIATQDMESREPRSERDKMKRGKEKSRSASNSLQQRLDEALARSGEDLDEEEPYAVAIVRPWLIAERPRARAEPSPYPLLRRLFTYLFLICFTLFYLCTALMYLCIAFLWFFTFGLLEGKCNALLAASRRGRLQEVQQLINGGAPVSYRNAFGMTALQLAAEGGCTEVVSVLISAGAPLDAGDIFGLTPLHLAVMHGHGHVVSALVNAGAAIGATNFARLTPLHHAAYYGQPQCLEILLAAGADTDAVDIKGDTPLHLAADYDHEQCARLLINEGADRSVRNKVGFTARDYAATPAIRALFP